MRALYDSCLAVLRTSCLTEATHHPGQFFQLTTEKTAFILNITLEADAYLHIVYGFTSTAFFALGPGEKEYFLQTGARSNDITLRRCADAWDAESLVRAEADIRGFYEAHRAFDKDELLNIAREERKEFIAQVGAILKPHKFRKKGNIWTTQVENDFILEFHAQKSSFSDEYYFNIHFYSRKVSQPFGCFYTRVTAGGSDRFDWQLLERDALLRTLESGIRQRLLPFLTTPLSNLGRENWIWQSCACSRNACVHCWVEKNLWEYKERGN
ncbi:MAG: DUF4304 domain-containing protein [Ruminococcaceae bacterium]|nr:DUF4304 domain-containing protein [Oscillospiraceae bacterium]